MFRFKALVCAAACLWGLTLPLMAQSTSSQFIEISATEQQAIGTMRQFYTRVSDLWLELRLDPNVDAGGVKALLDEVSDSLKKLENSNDPRPGLEKVYQQLLEAQIRMLPTRNIELRGALLDAGMLPRDPEGMQQLMKRLKAAGFNAVFPEIFRRGYALFPNPLIDLEPGLPPNADMLKLVSDAAVAEGLGVYPWFWMFRVLSPTVSKQNPLSRRLPALLAHPLDGDPYRSPNEEIEDESAAFMSPASEEWRQLLTNLIVRSASRYPVQGFLMDYIRYPNNMTEDNLSLTRFQLDYFRQHGQYPNQRIDRFSPLAADWHLWREGQVHDMVRRLRSGLSSQSPHFALGAAVFRNEVQARLSKMQNWRHWSNNHWIDYVSSMMYTTDHRDLELWMEWETNQGKRHDVMYPILGAHKIRGDRLSLLNQIATLQQRQASGMSIFSMRNVNETMLGDLGKGPFRKAAEPPHLNLPKALATQLTTTAEWLRGLEKRANETQTSLTSQVPLTVLISKLEQAAAPLANAQPRSILVPGDRMVATTKALRDEVFNSTRLFPAKIRSRLVERLEDAHELAQIYATHIAVKDQRFQQSSRPPTDILPEARAIPNLTVSLAGAPPEIDARLDDAAWRNSTSVPRLFWSTGSARPQINTEIRLSYDSNALYVSYVNAEPNTSRMRVSYRQEARLIQEDDTVQVFLSPVDGSQRYYYFVLNPANVRYERSSADPNWRQPWQSAARQFANGWIAEMAIPFRSMGVKAPAKNQVWRANFCRRRPQEIQDFHCWSVTFGGVHRPDRFGSLRFQPLPEVKDEKTTGGKSKGLKN